MTEKKKAPTKYDRGAKHDWVRKVVRDARLCAWKHDMPKDELAALADGLVNGFDGDGTKEAL